MKVGVLGAGSMGIGIAQIAASNGHQVVLLDNNANAIEFSMTKLKSVLDRLVQKNRLEVQEAKDLFGRIETTSIMNEFNDCDIVFEAIIENLDVKKSVFKKLEEVVRPDCILASNTSSLSVASIASSIKSAHRVIGIHFFNPAPLMKLVEIIPSVQTDPNIVKQSKDLIDSWSKVSVITKDTPGFIVNRVARPFYGEALRILEEGIADVPTIDWAMTTIGGFRMGPFMLMDYIGNDVNYIVTETVFQAFYYDPRYKPSFTQRRLAEAGYLGRKTGRGYYDYSDGAVAPIAVTDMKLGQQIVDRIVLMLINEAADAFFWQIASAEDIDLAMLNGVNYPKGLLAWGQEKGWQACVDQMDTLYELYHEDRYRCSPMLRRLAKGTVSL